MKTINIYEIINNERFEHTEDALKVCKEMKKVYYSESQIIMDFKNITFILTSAINHSLGFFIQKYGKDAVSKKVKIANIVDKDLLYPIKLSIVGMEEIFLKGQKSKD